MSETFAYAAGIIDGEGCIGISRRTKLFQRSKSLGYNVECTVNMVSPKSIEFLRHNWGGSIHQRKRQNPRWKSTYSWKVTGENARKLLCDILPFLKVKSEQATIAIKFLDHMQESKKETLGGHNMVGGRLAKVPQHIIDLRENLYQQMRELNRRGVKDQD